MRAVVLAVLMGLALVGLGDLTPGIAGASTPVSVGIDSNNSNVTLAPGQQLEVALPAITAAGFRWAPTQLDKNVLRQDGDPIYPTAPGGSFPGLGGLVMYRFTAQHPGSTELHMAESQSGRASVQTFSLLVTVE